MEGTQASMLNPIFTTTSELIEAYSSVLTFPYIDTLTIVHHIHTEALKIVQAMEKECQPKSKKEKGTEWQARRMSSSSSTSNSNNLILGERRLTRGRSDSLSQRDKRIFGVELVQVMEIQRAREPWLADISIPLFIDQALRYLYSHGTTQDQPPCSMHNDNICFLQ